MSDGPQQQKRRKIKKVHNPRKPLFGSYLHTVMKQIDGNVSISHEAMLVVDAFVVDFADRLGAKSFKLAKYDQKSTLKARHVKGGVNQMFRGYLAQCAVAEGEKALAKFQAP
tara:strand:- start:1951 stop:2286 length:336 start_codon:yes stop_codon:yes gene_type:complete